MSILSEFLTTLGVQDDFCIQLKSQKETRRKYTRLTHASCAASLGRGVNQSVISRRLRREGEVTPSRKYLHPVANRRHGLAGASPSRISLTLPKPYLGILVLGQDSDKSHFGSHPLGRTITTTSYRHKLTYLLP
uniref:Uncharacterized protein n=1 Tax=Candidatus Kentrum sp. FM TaxID=2126340 RepID=A0A450U2A2_9GAMM|nr:MAG: hypothetical protein BECKFM1743C_GA0114222_109602 [Candidatus Kentron sp. FM]VFJ77169.1 MAG: hypothetical protein BECKFM1743A_GA0114220_109662 [Candidatus Kentron sp. FM]